MLDTISESAELAQSCPNRAERRCHHCRAPLASKDIKFCCKGCEFVNSSIHALGLSAFYSLRAEQSESLGTKVQPSRSYSYLSDPEIRAQIADDLPDGTTRIRFYLPTIHCAACVWILEKLPHVIAGVRESRVSFSAGQIEIVADLRILSLERLAAVLQSIGYPPVPAVASAIERGNRRETRAMLMRIGVAAVCAANTMMIADSLFQSFFTGMEQQFLWLFTWASALIALPAVTYAALPFYRSAIGTLVTGRVHIDLPISIAIIASYLSDLSSVTRGNAGVYFDSITCLIFLLLVARYVQAQSISRARASTATTWDYLPSLVRVSQGALLIEKPLRELVPGDCVEVRPEERVPADATIISGSSSVDDSFLTGESLPRHVAAGDLVLGGSLNIDGVLELNVQQTGHHTRLGKIIERLKNGQGHSTQIEDEVNRLSGYLVGAVLALAAGTFIYWNAIDSGRALEITISLLVVTCPCALGLAIPITLAVALSQAKTSGLFVQSSQALHNLSRAEHFYFDKTGTLTTGVLTVAHYLGDEAALRIAKSLAQASSIHPVSKALELYCASSSNTELTHIQHHPGKGVQATTTLDIGVSLGSYKWANERAIRISDFFQIEIKSWLNAGMSVSLIEMNRECIGVFGLIDQIAPQARRIVGDLQAAGKQVFILSGDAQIIVDTVADKLSVPVTNVYGDLYPEQKAEIVASDRAIKVLVGDGLNDAQAMQNADVGIGVSGGIEATLEVADIFIARSGLSGFENALHGARQARAVIRRNLAFSIVYNAAAASLAILGHVTPLIAAILMPLSSFCVILSSSLSRYFREPARD